MMGASAGKDWDSFIDRMCRLETENTELLQKVQQLEAENAELCKIIQHLKGKDKESYTRKTTTTADFDHDIVIGTDKIEL